MNRRPWIIGALAVVAGAATLSPLLPSASNQSVVAAADAIPDTGLPASTVSASNYVVTSTPHNIGWGLSTQSDPADQYPNVHTLGGAIEILGDVVYVGGKFNYVRQGANGPLITQKYLAAFDRLTGAWISTWRPIVDGAIWDIEKTPDGKLLVLGNFTSFNGVADTAGIAKIDPATGTVDPTFKLKLTRTPGRVIGRSVSIKGDWAYMAGRFNDAWGGPVATANNGIGGLLKFKWSDGTPVPTWRPWTNTTVETVEASKVNDIVWIGGFFTTVAGQVANGTAAISQITGQRVLAAETQKVITSSPVAMHWNGGEPTWDLHEYGNAVFQASTNHYIGRHDTKTFAQTAYATQGNGDYQVVEDMYGIMYGGCHCGYPTTTKQVDGQIVSGQPLSAAGAWIADSFVRQPQWQPDVRSWSVGPWSMDADPLTGCLWMGGDWLAGPPTVYTSGFAKFCSLAKPGDQTPPSVPTNFTAVSEGTGVRLSWNPSTDNLPGALTYEVIRTTPTAVTAIPAGTTWFDPNPATARYFVRAVDAAGNRSATTAVLAWSGPTTTALVAATDQWRYKADAAPDALWATTSALTGWLTGAAPLGSAMGQTTTIPLTQATQYFVKDLSITSLAGWGTVQVRVTADDAFTLRVNGVEVTRDNLPGGPTTHTTAAWAESTVPTGRVRIVSLPTSLFKVGTNRIAVELHQARANDTDALFGATMSIVPIGTDTTAPAAPTLSSPSQGETGIALAWTRPADADLAGYLLTADGAVIGVFRPEELAFLQQNLAPGTRHNYSLAAFDRSGNLSTAATLGAQTKSEAPKATTVLAGPDSLWSVLADGTNPPLDWATTAALTNWTTGKAPLGNGFTVTTPVASTAITQYYATEFTTQTPGFNQLELKLAVDDAAIVRLNGVEIARANLPFGTPGPLTAAYAAVATAPSVKVYRLPSDTLFIGTNRLTVEVHQAAANDADAFMDASLTGYISNGDTQKPSTPVLSGTASGGYAAQLNWPAITDNAGVGFIEITRGGQRIKLVGGAATSYLDQQLAPNHAYTYAITAYDTNGNKSTSNTVTVTTGAGLGGEIGWPRLNADGTWTWTPDAPYASYVVSDGATAIAATPSNLTTLSLATGVHNLTVVGVFADGTRSTPSKVTVANVPTAAPYTGTAIQSSEYGGYPASRAIDGNTNGAAANVAITQALPNTYWQLDLGSVKSISKIVVWNRTDCCGNRLGNARVLISDTPLNTTYATSLTEAKATLVMPALPGASTELSFSGTGRYVRVSLPTAQYLQLAEVQVFSSGTPTVTYPA